MQTNMFPVIYNRMVDVETEKKIEKANARYEDTVRLIEESSKGTDIGGGPFGGPNKVIKAGRYIGIFGGFFACYYKCNATLGEYNVMSGLVTWVIVAVLCMAISWAISLYVGNSNNKLRNEGESRIEIEKANLQSEIQKIKDDAAREKNQYLEEFNKNVQIHSVDLAESELATDVIEWMTNGFCKLIDAADRRGHIEIVEVPFVFEVYNDEIICCLGSYDFEFHRCEYLNTNLEQAALAKAIVSQIQLNIMMKYLKDVTGTDISIDIEDFSNDEGWITTITYIAPNGNYEDTRSW